MVGTIASQLDLQEITVYVCVYVKNINRIYCSEASVHSVFFVLVLWYGRGLQSAKEKAAFNVLQLRRTVVYELSNCDPHMPETPWNTYLLPVNDGWCVWNWGFWSTDYQVSFSKQPHLFLASCIDSSHMFFTLFQRMVRAAMGCVITGEIDPTWLIALPHWDAAKRSQTYDIYIYIIRM